MPQNAKILCVDDEPTSRELLAHVLSPMGCRVLTARSGAEALEIINGESVDLVLLDVLMPGLDGFEVCKTIKGAERTRNIPVIMITALVSKDDRIKGIEAGADDFLTKPFDPAEVRARVKMLLKVKRLNEKRMGDVLIELGLINDQQLQEALKIAKEKNIKVGEAIYAMGALSRDAIYWGLSSQLQMTYIELSPEMVDKDLVRKFPFDVLRRLQCLPLYETNAEIHFAVGDPTDQESMDAVKGLVSGKVIQLYLGLPEKIADILGYCEREMPSGPQPTEPPAVVTIPEAQPPARSPRDAREPRSASDAETSWNRLAAELLLLSPGAVCWLCRTTHGCRLVAEREGALEAGHDYPDEAYSLFRERTGPASAPLYPGNETVTVLSDRATGRRAAFKVRPMEAVGGGFVRIERLPTFGMEEFAARYPQAESLKNEAKNAFVDHRRLVVGGPEPALVKRVFYPLLKEEAAAPGFPAVVFIERQADVHFPEAAQLSGREWDLAAFLKSVGVDRAPAVFYEAGWSNAKSVEAALDGLLSVGQSPVILYLPFASAEEMREVISGYAESSGRDFSAVFVDAVRLVPVTRKKA